jgi:transposase-like protein
MATREKFKQSTEERRRRFFSEEFKQKKVREIEQKITTIAEVSRQYEVRPNNVSKWLAKYSNNYMKGVRTIVESESDTRKLVELRAKIAELERIIGQKQVQLEFKDKMIDLAEEVYGVDIKKKFESKPSSGTGDTGKDSPAV